MNCINLKIKTKKGKKFLYCTTIKKEITFDNCKDCANKEYKTKKVKNSFYMHNNYENNTFKKKKCTINRKKCAKKSTLNKKSPLIGGHKHKLTKATEIPMKVKKVVWERDNHRCIYCNKYVDVYYANSHFIKRGQLGKGIEENVVTACQNCHHLYDFGTNSEEMINYTREYLKSKYSDWNEEKLVYKKR